jgi:hypothetical protein
VNEPVLHGYTMADMSRIARGVVWLKRRQLGPCMPDEALEVAWEAIATVLCEAEERPEESELFALAWSAARRQVSGIRQMHGMTDRGTADTFIAGFTTYWRDLPANFEDALVERIAFRQAWRALRPYHRATFKAFADAGYRQQPAAELLGVARFTMRQRLALGYAEFAALWYGDEMPPARGRDRCEQPGLRGKRNALNQWRKDVA